MHLTGGCRQALRESGRPRYRDAMSGLTIGIDATNLRRGGGVTHLIELLSAASPADQGIGKVIVWSGGKTAARLPQRPWLESISPRALDGGLLSRTLWQWRRLGGEARAMGCDLVFAPGGTYSTNFRPFVSMSQNLLPFEWRELRRYGLSAMALKLVLLRLAQTRTFRRADGVIFLTDYARQAVTRVTGPLPGEIRKIPHGLSPRFFMAPRAQRPAASAEAPFRIVYVSIVDVYKHQRQVVEAVSLLRLAGLPVELELIGPAYAAAERRLRQTIDRVDPQSSWVRYRGERSYEDVHRAYEDADLAVFASSCENQPIILLEMMAAGVPVASSSRGPMPEMLGEAGVYFDPESPDEIARALRGVLDAPEVRAALATRSFKAAQAYSWTDTANSTFAFLASVARQSKLAK